jgi:hypothetical protein
MVQYLIKHGDNFTFHSLEIYELLSVGVKGLIFMLTLQAVSPCLYKIQVLSLTGKNYFIIECSTYH